MTGNQLNDAQATEISERDPWLGSIVGQRYRVEERIGQGGMGVVYRGQHLELGKRVAIKRLDPRIASDPEGFERFRQEAIAVSRIESPHVVHVFDWGKADDGSPYLVMELLEGCDLRELFRREGRLLVDHAIRLVGQVLRALTRTHAAQILHRDLKPENVFLCNYGSDELYVKLLDFGISKRLVATDAAPAVTKRGVILGTACYMSPEQARGDMTLDVRSDLYSVGAILYEALTGQVPHRARTYEATLVAICTQDANDVRLLAPLVPAAVADIVAKALQRDPQDRFDSAKAFLDAINQVLPDLGVRISDPGLEQTPGTLPSSTSTKREAPPPSGGRARSKRVVLAVVVALALAAVAAGYPMLGRRRIPAVAPESTHGASASQLPSAFATGTQSEARPTPEMSAATPSSATKPELDASAGTISPKLPAHRQGPTNNPPASPAQEAPGVASGLKLRRTMP